MRRVSINLEIHLEARESITPPRSEEKRLQRGYSLTTRTSWRTDVSSVKLAVSELIKQMSPQRREREPGTREENDTRVYSLESPADRPLNLIWRRNCTFLSALALSVYTAVIVSIFTTSFLYNSFYQNYRCWCAHFNLACIIVILFGCKSIP